MKIVHIIDSLLLGGTENQFLGLLPDLARSHDIALVTLRDGDRPGLGQLPVTMRYGLGFSGPGSLLGAASRLRKIIADEKPDLVRSQLYWSSIVARLATPRSIPLIFSIHSTMSADSKRPSALWLEKLTYRRRHHLLGVSRHVVDDFDRHVGLKGRSDALVNFIRPEFLERTREKRPFTAPFKLVAVGNLKEAKNYSCLVSAMKQLPADLTLDIYGEGHLRQQLEQAIASDALPVELCGAREDIWNVLPGYDLFLMPSLHEGCPNAVIEAMAAGLPLILSDIPPMHEVSHGNALFFDPHDPQSFVAVMRRVLRGEADLTAMAERGLAIVRANYRKADYLQRLNAIYADAVASSGKAADGARR